MAALVLFRGFQSEKISVRTGDLSGIGNSKRYQSDIGTKRYPGVRIHMRSKRQPIAVSACFKGVSVILLAGGKGKRMGGSMPKQYLPLLGRPIALYSFYTFSQHLDEVKEIVVVCDPSYKNVFLDAEANVRVNIKYSLPGKERQYSVYNGLLKTDPNAELVCIHDSARPLVTSEDIKKVLNDGRVHGAAALGVPLKATIKEVNSESFVLTTPDRKILWEIQTPQVIKTELLRKGFELVNRDGLEVTDDVSIVEHINHPVYITAGSYSNIKVTTPADLLQAESLLASTSKTHTDIGISSGHNNS